jgi:hypothetical protein
MRKRRRRSGADKGDKRRGHRTGKSQWQKRNCDQDRDGDGDRGGSGHRNYCACLFKGEYVQFTVGSNPVTGQPCAKRVSGPRRGPLLMDFGTYRYIRYRNPGPA